MADVLLFHHAQGLTPGVHGFADRLRSAGHRVTAPDLYDGATFDALDDGVGHAQEIGFDVVIERGRRAAEPLPPGLVHVGFSLGALPAQMLAQTRPGARGAVLCHGCVPTAEFGCPWPDAVPVQVHAMEHDALFVDDGDLDAARALVRDAADAELFLYAGDGHLFTDSGLPDHDAAATDLLLRRVLGLLDRVDRQGQP